MASDRCPENNLVPTSLAPGFPIDSVARFSSNTDSMQSALRQSKEDTASSESPEAHSQSMEAVISEQLPLLSPTGSDGEEAGLGPMSRWCSVEEDLSEDRGEDAKSTWYLFLLTSAVLGPSIAWAVEWSNGSPYLISLGISKSTLSLVWIAGPLFGVLVQPYIGIKSDNYRSKWGKRRPFIIAGAIATILSFLMLAWVNEIVRGVLYLFGGRPDSDGVKNAVIFFAVALVYALDFAINALQAAIRAFFVDCTPTHQQASVNAWAAGMNGFGNILGYLFGYVDLPSLFPFLGNTHFKVLCVIASLLIGLTTAISCRSIAERDPSRDTRSQDHDSVFAFFRSVQRSAKYLPSQIKHVCAVQFFAWMAWFPFLFYITTYIGEIYASPIISQDPQMTEEQFNELWEQGIREGTFALFIFAFTSFAASVFLPIIVTTRSDSQERLVKLSPIPLVVATPHSSNHGESSHSNRTQSPTLYFPQPPSHRLPQTLLSKAKNALNCLRVPGLTLQRTWFISHLFFAACMTLASFLSSVLGLTFVVALIGIPWAVSGWVPYALISSEVSKRDAIRRGLLKPTYGASHPSLNLRSVSGQFNTDSTPLSFNDAASQPRDGYEGEDQAGIVFGLHNAAISAPQMIATLLLSIVFSQLQKPRNEVGDHSVAWVLRLGGMCALVAAALTRRVGEGEEVKVKD